MRPTLPLFLFQLILLGGGWLDTRRGGGGGGGGPVRLAAAQGDGDNSTTPPTLSPVATPPPVTSPPTPDRTPEPTPAPAETPDPTPAPMAEETPEPTTPEPTAEPTTPKPTAEPTTPKPTVYNTPPPTPWKGIAYHSDPPVRWTRKLPGTGGNDDPAPRRGNSVSVGPDDAFVYVTMDDGELTILDAADGTTRGRVVPAAKNGGTVTCRSGVTFGRKAGMGPYAIYALTETGGAAGGTKSRVVAVEHPSGNVLWTSPDMDGEVSGTPMIGEDGTFIYLTRNVGIVGHFTLLRISDEGDSAEVYFTEVSGKYNVNDTGTYAPLNVAHNPMRGNFNGGQRNRNDVAAWGHLYTGGTDVSGRTVVFQFPEGWADGSTDPASLRTRTLEDVAWKTHSKPALSSDGMDIYYGVTKAEMRGWHDTRWGRGPWKAELDKDPANGRTPVPKTATLSNDETTLFLPSAGNSFHAILAATGVSVWRRPTDTEIVTEARVSPDDQRVYSIQQSDGKVTAHRASDGAPVWSSNCRKYQSTNPFCQYHVEAEFSLSSTGYYLYYSDTRGTVVALTLGFAPLPTMAPTPKPTAVPTPGPTATPTLAPIPTATPTYMPTPEQPFTRPPTPQPTLEPTPIPTAEPTLAPIPTAEPTAMPTPEEPWTRPPTTEPTEEPTAEPVAPPTAAPSSAPTEGTPPPLFDTRSGGVRAFHPSRWWASLAPLAAYCLVFVV